MKNLLNYTWVCPNSEQGCLRPINPLKNSINRKTNKEERKGTML
jgi:hypothetical protein